MLDSLGKYLKVTIKMFIAIYMFIHVINHLNSSLSESIYFYIIFHMIKFFLKKKKTILKTIAIKYNIEIQASPRLLNNLSIIHVCIKIYIKLRHVSRTI